LGHVWFTVFVGALHNSFKLYILSPNIFYTQTMQANVTQAHHIIWISLSKNSALFHR